MLIPPEMTYEGLKAVIADWETKTGNTIDVQNLSGDQLYFVLNSRISGGDGPDFFMSLGKSDEYTLDVSIIEPFNDRPWYKDIPDSVKKLMTYSDGTMPYIPTVPINAAGLAYNKKMFRDLGIDLPKNRKEFLAACETIKNAGVTPLNYQGAPGHEWGLGFWTHAGFSYYDKYYADADHWTKMNNNQKGFTDVPFYEKTLGQMVEYIDLGYVNEDWLSTTFDMTKERLANGEVAMAFVAEWIYGPVMTLNPDFEMGFFPLPVEDDKEGVLSGFIGGGLSVWKDSKNKEAALDFIDFLCTKEMQEKFYTITPGTPIFPYVDVPLTPVGEAIMKYSSEEKASPRFIVYDRIYLHADFNKLLQEMLSKVKTPKEFLAAYEKARDQAGQQKEMTGF